MKIKNIFGIFKKKRVLYLAGGLIIVFLAGFIALRSYRQRENAVAVVNNEYVTFEDIEAKLQATPAFYADYVKENPRVAVDDYVNQLLLFQQAKAHEEKYREEIKYRVRNYYMELVTEKFVENEISNRIKISQEEIADYYNNHLEEFIIPEKVRIYEIVVDSREKARHIINRLQAGEMFEKIAQNESISSSRLKEGDLGWLGVKKLDPEVASLVTQMNPGEILANVIETSIGYHIIKLVGKSEQRTLSLQEAEEPIKELLKSQKKKREVEKFVENFREKSSVLIFPEKIEILKERLK
jgi:peptidyl-prolyl cis-trans isomerase C